MIPIFIPRSRKSAGLMAITTGSLFIIALLIFAFLFGKSYIKQKTWITIPATVSDYSISDAHNVWTEFTYQMDGATHTVQLEGHSYWMHKGDEIELLCSPNDSQKIEVKSYINSYPKAIIALPLVFGGIWLLYFVLFLYWRHKEPKVAS